jgi:hypothetical protein
MRPDCYKCKHRRNIPGDCHSECNHPEAMTMMLGSLLGKDVPNKVQGKAHGISHGWFNWPFNFDPIWLEKCSLFESKDDS